jgi:hypothetical protein
VDAFGQGEKQVLAALFLDWHRDSERLLGADELRDIYGLTMSKKMISAILADLKSRGFIEGFEDKDGGSGFVTDRTYALTRDEVMRELGNPETFDVDWTKEEILTEADTPKWFPVPNGWKWYTVEPKPADSPFDAGVFDSAAFDTGENQTGGRRHDLQADNLETGPPDIGSATLQVHDATSATNMGPVTGDAHAVGEMGRTVSVTPMEGSASGTHVLLTADATSIKQSSAWTGRKSVAEQVRTIETFAPLAQMAVKEVERAVTEKRFNDPETNEALAALKELHYALGELIHTAQNRGALAPVWDKLEDNKERLFKSVANGAKLMVGAPILSIGMAYVLSTLSGFPMSADMLATLCGGSVIGDAVRKRKG